MSAPANTAQTHRAAPANTAQTHRAAPANTAQTHTADDVHKFSQEKRDEEHALLLKNLKNKKTKKILIIGEQGVGKSSFVNSAAMAITGQYACIAQAGSGGENASNVTITLTSCTPKDYCAEKMRSPIMRILRFLNIIKRDALDNMPVFIDVMGFDDNLSKRLVEANMDSQSDTDPAMLRFGDHVESVNSILMDYMLRGRIPNDCSLLEFGKLVMQGKLEMLAKLENFQEKEELKVDAVVMIIPRGCNNLPKKLLNTIKQETKRRDLNVPVFGVMTKFDQWELDGEISWGKLAREFRAELGIDGNFFIPLTNYVYDDLLKDEPEPNPDTDVPLLKMLNQIYKTKAKKIFLPGEELEKQEEEERKKEMEKENRCNCCSYMLISVIILLLAFVVAFIVSNGV